MVFFVCLVVWGGFGDLFWFGFFCGVFVICCCFVVLCCGFVCFSPQNVTGNKKQQNADTLLHVRISTDRNMISSPVLHSCSGEIYWDEKLERQDS